MNKVEEYKKFEKGAQELVEMLIEDHMGWACSIARSVARSWNLDYQLDGLDGGAYEGLLFCAQRYDPQMEVPFRGYARRRIHEASTEEARKSKSWQKGVGTQTPEEQSAREISARLLQVFPELRTGFIVDDKDQEGSARNIIREMLSSANILHAFEESIQDNPVNILELKELLEKISNLEQIHQEVIFAIYWKDLSMRKIAQEWEVDELVIIREHKEILNYVFSMFSGKNANLKKLKIRPGLRPLAQKFREDKSPSPFEQFFQEAGFIDLAMMYYLFSGIFKLLSKRFL